MNAAAAAASPPSINNKSQIDLAQINRHFIDHEMNFQRAPRKVGRFPLNINQTLQALSLKSKIAASNWTLNLHISAEVLLFAWFFGNDFKSTFWPFHCDETISRLIRCTNIDSVNTITTHCVQRTNDGINIKFQFPP